MLNNNFENQHRKSTLKINIEKYDIENHLITSNGWIYWICVQSILVYDNDRPRGNNIVYFFLMSVFNFDFQCRIFKCLFLILIFDVDFQCCCLTIIFNVFFFFSFLLGFFSKYFSALIIFLYFYFLLFNFSTNIFFYFMLLYIIIFYYNISFLLFFYFDCVYFFVSFHFLFFFPQKLTYLTMIMMGHHTSAHKQKIIENALCKALSRLKILREYREIVNCQTRAAVSK